MSNFGNDAPNDDETDVDNFDDSSSFDDYSKKGTLGDIWRNQPGVKVGVILAGFAIIVAAIILFSGGDEPQRTSALSGPQDVNEAPGSSEISETMRQSIEDVNMENVEDATRTGGSAVPIPTETTKGTLPITMDDDNGEDPLERWRRMQEERVRQQEILAQSQPPAEAPAPPVDTRTPAVNALSESMVSQMQAVMNNQKIPKPNYKRITPTNFLEELEAKKMQQFQQQQQMVAANQQVGQQVENILIPAGTIEYAQLLIEANTDAPGPVLAQIVSGPLRGARVIGNFQSTDNYIILNFSAVVVDGINYPVQAVGIDPDTTLPGVITEIDHRYFRRIILPAAAEFVQGFANAFAQGDSTSIFIDNGTVATSTGRRRPGEALAEGIQEAGDQVSDVLEEEGDNTKIMLRVASGTPLGILFVGPVSDIANRN